MVDSWWIHTSKEEVSTFSFGLLKVGIQDPHHLPTELLDTGGFINGGKEIFSKGGGGGSSCMTVPAASKMGTANSSWTVAKKLLNFLLSEGGVSSRDGDLSVPAPCPSRWIVEGGLAWTSASGRTSLSFVEGPALPEAFEVAWEEACEV